MTDIFGLMAGIAGSTPAPVPLTGVKVQADILGRGAKVKVSQRFSNREPSAVEAVYKFPLPEGAAICGFRALIDERVIQGVPPPFLPVVHPVVCNPGLSLSKER